jgi:hypothetical protein
MFYKNANNFVINAQLCTGHFHYQLNWHNIINHTWTGLALISAIAQDLWKPWARAQHGLSACANLRSKKYVFLSRFDGNHLKSYVNSTKNHKSYQFSLTICFYFHIFSLWWYISQNWKKLSSAPVKSFKQNLERKVSALIFGSERERTIFFWARAQLCHWARAQNIWARMSKYV